MSLVRHVPSFRKKMLSKNNGRIPRRPDAGKYEESTMTQNTKDTADDICNMLMQGYTPDYLFGWEENGFRIDPAAIEKGIELAIKKLRQEAGRDFAEATELERFKRHRRLRVV
jgi:hypothetical protein